MTVGNWNASLLKGGLIQLKLKSYYSVAGGGFTSTDKCYYKEVPGAKVCLSWKNELWQMHLAENDTKVKCHYMFCVVLQRFQ